MGEICKSCGAELPLTPPGSTRRPCPDCGEAARVIVANVHAMVGSATCNATGIVIRPDPVGLELGAPLEVDVGEPPEVVRPLRGRALVARRNAAHDILVEDIRREDGESLILGYLVERLEALRNRMRREAKKGDYDG